MVVKDFATWKVMFKKWMEERNCEECRFDKETCNTAGCLDEFEEKYIEEVTE